MRYTHCTDCNKEKLTYVAKRSALCKSCVQKGKTRSEEHCNKLSESAKGKTASEETRRKLSISRGGTGVVGEKTLVIPGLGAWRKAVKARDGACIDCGSTERLEAHHLVLKSKFPEVATELWNGITLCRKCHIVEHKIIGKK